MIHADLIRSLILDGKNNRDIKAVTNASKATISYHRKRLNRGHNPRKKHNWIAIQEFHQTNRRVDCLKKFGVSNAAWGKAINTGKLIPVSFRSQTLNQLVEHSTFDRGRLKKRLVDEDILIEKCAECGIGPIWNDMPLTLTLDHINGVNDDNRLDNLRFLCPNCHSQTSTFAGRNVKRLSKVEKIV